MSIEGQLFRTIFNEEFWYNIHNPMIKNKIEIVEKENLTSYLETELFPRVKYMQQSAAGVIKALYGKVISDSNKGIHFEDSHSPDTFDMESNTLEDYIKIDTTNHYDKIYKICKRHGGMVASDVMKYLERNGLLSEPT